MTLIALNHRERSVLERLAARTDHARELCRVQALLWLDDGQSPQEVADLLRISRQTTYNWAARITCDSCLKLVKTGKASRCQASWKR